MASPFGALFAQILARKGLSQRDFARLVGRTGVFISLVTRGRRRVPLKDLDLWLTALDLTPRERQDLSIQALLSHCPEAIQALVTRLLRRTKRSGTRTRTGSQRCQQEATAPV